jgi:hypothetical protein
LISDAGYVRKGYTKEDVLHQGVSILRDADRAICREHAPAADPRVDRPPA